MHPFQDAYISIAIFTDIKITILETVIQKLTTKRMYIDLRLVLTQQHKVYKLVHFILFYMKHKIDLRLFRGL